MRYTFIELPPFAALRDKLFEDDDFADFQAFLCRHPEVGDVIPQTGGCRKIRIHRTPGWFGAPDCDE
jgi:hypothetical protein